ncbi:hypothetical protein [Microvirga alba]|uniref:Uncharacterized protein n=1 Tax=Microvirga alba TaxID=2791025 RepID=A0A931BNX5_9HYPH|nr:hypothetical protein [Microvirga alba]MBF9234687.1 hypothetical protein [Microvirga alba]
MVAVPFPLSSTPGLRPGEGEGRIVNGYNEKAGDRVYNRRSAGLSVFANTTKSGPRGLIDVNGTLYAVYSGAVVKVSSAGTVTTLTGSIPGTDGVTLARNNKVTGGVSTPDIVAVREGGGAYILTETAVSAYPGTNLPATVNSVDFQDGFFDFTIPDGRIFASELNSTNINALSFATAEAKPDGLKRGFVHAGTYFAMGTETIEPWKNVGAMPFPLARMTSVLPVGLLTTMAVAGFELGWDREPHFVAHDGTVRALRGFDTPRVSTPDVEAFIARSTVSTLEAYVYTAKGNAYWVLSSDAGTWELNVSSGLWNERLSTGTNRWRASHSVKLNGAWIMGDTLSTNLLKVEDGLRTEAGVVAPWTIESQPLKDFPVRVAVPGIYGDFTEADGAMVDVSWSHDGGKTWATPLSRSLSQADKYPVSVNRAGLSTHHGLRVRFSSSSTQDFSFMGASVPDLQQRRP